MSKEVKNYKVLNLPTSPQPDSVYYVLGQNSEIGSARVKGYITDKTGFPVPFIDENSGGLQPGANISLLNNNVGYITVADLPSQDNFVRILIINQNLLSGIGGLKQQVCDYILSLPESERTILETDSKWNIIVQKFSNPFLRQFPLSTLTGIYCDSEYNTVDNYAYFDGESDHPVVGDTCYTSQMADEYLASTKNFPQEYAYTFLYGGSNLGFLRIGSNGKVIDFSECN